MTQISLAKCKVDQLVSLCEEFGNQPGELINILHKAQGLIGYLPREVQEVIARQLNIPVSKVYGVVTFYSFFTMTPKGEHPISVCMGTACYVRGAEKVLDEFKRILKINVGETTPDGKFSLTSLRCVGACGLAPVVLIGEKVYGRVTPGEVEKILKTLPLDRCFGSLTPQEIEGLMEIIDNLTADGKSVILITHKLKEITASSDNCTIIRQGKYIQTVKVADVNENELAAMMVGRDVNFKVDKKDQDPGEVVLNIEDLHAKDYRGVEILKGFHLNVRRGEIVGLAGVDGNGQTELVEVLTGLRKAESGKVTMLGKDVFNKTPKETFESGISSIPADRQKHGLILEFSNEDNLILQHFEEEPYSSHGILNRKAIKEHAEELIEKFDVRPRGCAESPAGTLSGGNQQKVIIAREVTNDKELLIAVNPTRGLDVGAIEFVHKYLVEQRNKNRAVLLVSFELDEIMSLSDRIEVIFDGQITGSVAGKDADEKELGFMMAGGKTNE